MSDQHEYQTPQQNLHDARVATHPSVQQVLRYFEYDHLPTGVLRDTSMKFCVLAVDLAWQLQGPELTIGLRKLLEAKDCCVRAALPPR